jgi:hypothetical protein
MDGSQYGLTTEDSLYYRYNSTMRARVPAEVERWADYSRIIDSALDKLPSQQATVYRGFHVSLTQVSHEFQPGKVVWLPSITSTTTDEKHTLKIFGSGSSSSPGTLMKIHALSAKDIKSFSVLPEESELVFSLNTCLSIERVVTSQELMSLKGLIEDLPENVDLIVARQQRVTKDVVTAAVNKDAHDLTVFKSQHFASASLALPALDKLFAAGAASSPGAVAVPHALVHATAPTASSSASTSGDYMRLLQQFQDMLQAPAVASICYYRNTAFAAALCDEFGAAAADEGALADAAHYAAASKSLHAVVAAQGSPTSADALASLLAQANRAVPQIEAAQAAAKTVKDFSKAAELQNLR